MTVQVPRSGNQERAAGGTRIDPAHRSSSSLTWCTCTTGAADVIAYKTRAPVASFKLAKTTDSLVNLKATRCGLEDRSLVRLNDGRRVPR